MADMNSSEMSRLPEEMLKFVLESAHGLSHSPRIGRLLSHGRPPIQTPHYIAATSRGVIPHLSQDLLQMHTDISAVYMGLEDCSILILASHRKVLLQRTHSQNTDEAWESALCRFTALPAQCLSILGPRRVPRINTSAQNSDSSVAISTSVGFRFLELSDYVKSTSTLRPNVSAVLSDLPSGEKMSKRRIEKSTDRTQAWLKYTLSQDDISATSMLASIPPLEVEQQQLFISDLCDEYSDSVSGLCIYEPSTALVVHRQLSRLPIVCISDPPNPHSLLQNISLGIDLVTTPFVTAASEQGIAFTFTFPPPMTSSTNDTPPSQSTKQSLGLDLFSPTLATSLSPLSPRLTNNGTEESSLTKTEPPCQCYTCTVHHRAFVHHLLSTREMLAWTLLQIHNFHILSIFFSAIRHSIRNGTFDADRKAFEDYYSEDFGVVDREILTNDTQDSVHADNKPDGLRSSKHPSQETERGPRLRGYQMKSLGKGQDKKREKIWGRFDNDSPRSTPQSTGTPAEFNLGTETDQAMRVEEAVASTKRTEDLHFTASDFESLGLAEKEENAEK